MKNYRTYGQPPYATALLHGGPGALGDLAPLARELSAHCGVLELLQTGSTIETLIQELHDQLQEAAHLPVRLIGHSWGAWLAMLFAARYPALVLKLILIGVPPFTEEQEKVTTGIRYLRMTATERREWIALIETLEQDENEFNPTHFRTLSRLMTNIDAYALLPLENEQLELKPELYHSVWKEASAWRHSGRLLDAVKDVACPVVIIHGADDPHPLAGIREPLLPLLPDVVYCLLEKCGHYPWREQWAREAFWEQLLSELALGAPKG